MLCVFPNSRACTFSPLVFIWREDFFKYDTQGKIEYRKKKRLTFCEIIVSLLVFQLLLIHCIALTENVSTIFSIFSGKDCK